MKSPLPTVCIVFLILLAVTVTLPVTVRAQTCPNANYTLTTQAEVDTFHGGPDLS